MRYHPHNRHFLVFVQHDHEEMSRRAAKYLHTKVRDKPDLLLCAATGGTPTRAYELFAHNFSYRYVRRGNPERYADRRDFAHELERGSILVGSPGTVREQLRDYLDRSGANYVVGCFSFGSLPLEQILTSLELFTEQVMPALSQPQAVSA